MLDGVRVLDRSTDIAGPYCTKVLADAGADVVKVEPPEGDPLRGWRSGALFEFLNTSKRSVLDDTGLLDGADILVVDRPVDVAAIRAAHPSLVVVTITPFGLDGPWADRPATEFTLQAACGSIGGRGFPDEPPIAAGGRIGEFEAGTYAAIGALAALRESERSGHGDHVDVALLDCMSITLATYPSLFAQLMGWPPVQGTGRTIEVPSIEPASDGYVVFTTNSAQQFQDFLIMIGHAELLADKDLPVAAKRFARRAEYLGYVHEHTTKHTSAELLEEAGAFRVPAGPVLNGATVTSFEQFEQRGVFVPNPTGRFRQPRVPFTIEGAPARPFEPAPALGADDGAVDWSPRPAREQGEWKLPLDGLRILDITAWWAGPTGVHVLATLGADVVKIESTTRPDLMRLSGGKPATEPNWWEWGGLFHAVNNNKRGVAIDLTRPEGKEAFEALLRTADVLIENMTPRVMEQFGLGWERIHEVNPDLVMVRMPAFGLDGPWRERGGFAQTMESITGMAWVTGQEDGPPVLVRGACDPLSGMHAAIATLLALRLGGGRHVESVMVEAALQAAAEQVVEYESSGELLTRHGPQGIYRCAGDDRWIAVDADEDLTEWCANRDADEAAAELRARGIAAEAVIVPRDVHVNPQLRHRGFFEALEHPVIGTFDYPALPFRMSRVDRWLRRPAPTIGQHNDEVLGEAVGEEELARLRKLGVVGEGLALR